MVRLSLSSACLDATTIPHASGAWCRIFHLMQVCCLPWCPGCPVLCVLRAWLLGACVSLALLGALLSWPACVPVAWYCGAVLCPAPWCVGLLCLPCGLGLCVGLVYRPLISPCYMGLFCGLVFRALYGPLKKCFIFALKFPARFSGPQRLDFFLRIFSRRFFRRKFPGYFFRALFSGIFPGLIFASISGFLFFLDVIFVRFPVFRDELFHVVKFQELVHGSLVDSVALTF